MRPAERRDPATLTERLTTQSHCFELFQAVRLLEQLAAGQRRPVGLGDDREPPAETVRFRAAISLTGQQIDRICCDHKDAPARLTQSFMSLLAPVGPLPMHYTEQLLEAPEDEEGGTPLADLLDAFVHRLLSLQYRAWAKYRPFLFGAADGLRDAPGGRQDVEALSPYLRALSGLGDSTLGLEPERGLDERLLACSGLLARRRPSAAALQSTVRSYFGLPIEIEQFVVTEERLAESCTAALGRRAHRLGSDAVLGKWARVVDGRFRVHVGPLSTSQLEALRPPGPAYRTLAALVALIAGPTLDFEICLRGTPAAAPALGAAQGPSLGRDAWLGSRPQVHQEHYGKDGEPAGLSSRPGTAAKSGA